MARLQKVTFEISVDSANDLRELKQKLQRAGIPVKQWQMIEYLIGNAKYAQMLKHFSQTATERIGENDIERRERRRQAYQKSKKRSVPSRRS